MKNIFFRRPERSLGLTICGFIFGCAWLLNIAKLHAVTVTTLGGGDPHVSPQYLGYRDGTTLSSALFHTPSGLAMDSTGSYLFVADRDNNAIRYLDLAAGQTWTFGIANTNLVSKPVGVVVDGSLNVSVLNRGNGNNGTVVTFDSFGDVVTTNAIGLTNACGITMDSIGNLYVTVRSNTVIKITPAGVRTNVVIIPMAGTSLQGIVAKHNGMLAVCDAGRNGIYLVNPVTGMVTTNAGFHGVGDFMTNGNNIASSSTAKFSQPTGIAEAGDGTLIVTDFGNSRVKVVFTSGVVTNLYGVASIFWGGIYKGWFDGTVSVPDSSAPNAQARLPFGVAFAPDGSVYTSEDFYHLIRKTTGAGFALPPPPPPPVPTPQIGWVDFPATSSPIAYTSVFHPVSSFVFHNDAPIIIQGVAGSQTYYTYLNTPNVGLVPDPTSASASAPVGYQDGLVASQVNGYAVAGIAPYVAIKAIGEKNDGSPNSAIAQATFQFVTDNPLVGGNNAAQFKVSDSTYGSVLYYTTDGSDPKSSPSAFATAFNPSTNLTVNTVTLNFSSNNFVFLCFARKLNYQDSQVASNYFSATGFIPNRITFGLTNGQPSSSFIARPGQFYYAPVTLQLQPGGETMYSLQFNITVTNGLSTSSKIVNGAGIGFSPMLMTQVSPDEGRYFPPLAGQWYLSIPALTTYVSGVTTNQVSTIFVNTNNNLIGVGWLYRTGFRYKLADTNGVYLDFDTAAQDLITYSIAHDTLFKKSDGVVVAGAYSFQIPTTAVIGNQYFMQIGSPSATRDGVGAPGASVYIQAPANSQAVTVGSPAYIVGDVAPFRWLNAGDFGEGMLDNSDVMQVFQSAILGVDMPPANSDLFLAMDSSGVFGTFDSANNYYTNAVALTPSQMQAMFDGNDASINTNAFGDGVLDVSDLYVTYRRSLDPSLTWFKRFWTNNQFVAVTTANLSYNSNTPNAVLTQPTTKLTVLSTATNTYQQSSVQFSAGDAIASGGQTVQIPITAKIFGSYPLRILGLNLTVHPLDGSPDLTQPVSFTPTASLGQPTIVASQYAANYSAAWLNAKISGLTGDTTIGTLTVTLPAGATSSSAYAVYFDHASASPNGIVSFPEQKFTGLITLASRTNSSYGDGIPDSWRLRWFGTTNNYLSLSNACPSGDGVNNFKKYVAGVDPSMANNFPSVNAKLPVPSGSTSAIHWPTVSGKQYVIELSSSLFSGAWTTIATNTGTGTDMEFDDNSAGAVKFYRVRILP